MKKLLFIPLLFGFTMVANAQIFKVFGHEIGFVYIGPKVGGTFSTISNFKDISGSNTQYRLGYQIGAVGEFGITSKFSFQTELLFYSRGTKMDDQHSRIKMNYVGIPLLVKYTFHAFGLTKVYAMAGTFNDIRTKGVEEYDAVGANPATTYDLPSGFKKHDWGLSFGAGAEYEKDKGIWGIDLRYNLGITDLTDLTGENVKTRSRSFGFALTYKFDMVDMYFKLTKKKKKDSNENGETNGSQENSGLKVDRSKE